MSTYYDMCCEARISSDRIMASVENANLDYHLWLAGELDEPCEDEITGDLFDYMVLDDDGEEE